MHPRRKHIYALALLLLVSLTTRADKVDDFVTDACATVAVAYRRAAGVYVEDEEMKQLGTAAVHLLTMATLYIGAQKE